jgi:hypothetical protein
LNGSVGGATERRKGGESGGSGHGGASQCRGGRGAWPRPAGGAPTVSRPAVTRARRARVAHRCSDRGALGTDGRAPVAVRAGREWRGACGVRAHVGQPEKETGWPSLDEQYGFGFI